MQYQTTQAHEEFRAKVREFAEAEIKPIAFMLDKENRFPTDAVKKMGQVPRDVWADKMTPAPPSTLASSSTAMA